MQQKLSMIKQGNPPRTRNSGPVRPDGLQAGATLVEILVTMLITGVALLGVAGMQLNAIRSSQTAKYREVAMDFAQNMAEKIRANTLTLSDLDNASAYRADLAYADANTMPDDPGCGLADTTSACTPAQSAHRDLRDWKLALAKELPGGRGAIQPVSHSSGGVSASQRRVIVMWSERPKDSDDNLSSAPVDANCPQNTAGGIRCLTLVVQP